MREMQFPLELRADPGGDAREVDLRIVPFSSIARTPQGLEMVQRGAFEGTDPAEIVLRQDHADPPAGRGIALEEREDAAYMTFRVAKTPRGDELLANLAEGMHRSASIGFEELPGGSTVRAYKGEPVRVHKHLRLREVGTTWRPVYPEAAVLAVRMEDLEMEQANETATTTPTPAPIYAVPGEMDNLRARMHELEERSREAITMPAGFTAAERDTALERGQWANLAIRAMAGARVDPSDLAFLHTRAAVDVITTDNLGVVPPQYRPEVIGIVNKSRPFLQSTREVPAGSSGLTFNFPKITQRPLTGVQAGEKTALPSRKTIIGTVPFDAVSVGGVGDLSIQLLQRSSPQFLTLWLDLLAEAYAINTDDLAVDALLAAVGVNAGGELDPAAPLFGSAFTNAAAGAPGSTALLPNRIWLSTDAVAAFMDAKSPAGGGGVPLYPGMASITGLTAGQGGPLPIQMTPVWVPALDDEAVDIVVGPSTGFAWAEDGTYTLTADVPEKAGRDVGLVGMVWLMPIYPAAFTTYTLPVVIP